MKNHLEVNLSAALDSEVFSGYFTWFFTLENKCHQLWLTRKPACTGLDIFKPQQWLSPHPLWQVQDHSRKHAITWQEKTSRYSSQEEPNRGQKRKHMEGWLVLMVDKRHILFCKVLHKNDSWHFKTKYYSYNKVVGWWCEVSHHNVTSWAGFLLYNLMIKY